MTMPGFTAEAGLSRTAALWRTEASAPAADREARVEPQFCICPPGGAYCTCCYCYGDYGCTCFTHRLHYLM